MQLCFVSLEHADFLTTGGMVIVTAALEHFCSRSACGRLPEITEDCFVEANYENVVAKRRTASEKRHRRVWVVSTR